MLSAHFVLLKTQTYFSLKTALEAAFLKAIALYSFYHLRIRLFAMTKSPYIPSLRLFVAVDDEEFGGEIDGYISFEDGVSVVNTRNVLQISINSHFLPLYHHHSFLVHYHLFLIEI